MTVCGPARRRKGEEPDHRITTSSRPRYIRHGTFHAAGTASVPAATHTQYTTGSTKDTRYTAGKGEQDAAHLGGGKRTQQGEARRSNTSPRAAALHTCDPQTPSDPPYTRASHLPYTANTLFISSSPPPPSQTITSQITSARYNKA